MRREKMGIGAIILAPMQMFTHPSAIIREKYPYPQQGAGSSALESVSCWEGDKGNQSSQPN